MTVRSLTRADFFAGFGQVVRQRAAGGAAKDEIMEQTTAAPANENTRENLKGKHPRRQALAFLRENTEASSLEVDDTDKYRQ